MTRSEWMTALQNTGCVVRENEPMSAHTTFKIGGPAAWFVAAETVEQVVAVLRLCAENDQPITLCGNGSNLLVSDTGVDGVVLHLSNDTIEVDGCCVTVGAGTSLTRLCRVVKDHALSGLEFAYGIPGTLGGGVYMNAGAYGGQLSDVVTSVRVLTADGALREMTADDLQFGYRHSALMEQSLIVWSVTMLLREGDCEQIQKEMNTHLTARREKQPLEYPSGGSFFKRPEGYFAGALIEQSGLKGYTVGGAQVSEKHAGFVINRGGATCADVMALCRHIQDTVYAAHGVRLEREVQLIGR